MSAGEMPMETFETMVAEAFARLPQWIREKAVNVALLVEEIPDRETVEELGLDSDTELLGLYKGVPRTERNNDAGYELPDTVTLYKLAIEAEAYAKGRLVGEIIYETLWHELGHHFGHDEEGIRKREEEEFGEQPLE
jgi:predicted Zn-dependent protease with MMP-like domain